MAIVLILFALGWTVLGIVMLVKTLGFLSAGTAYFNSHKGVASTDDEKFMASRGYVWDAKNGTWIKPAQDNK